MGIFFSDYKLAPKGPCIYLYTASNYEEYYGVNLYTKLMEKYKNIKFIVTCCLLAYEQIIKKPNLAKYGIKYYTKDQLINDVYP